MQRLLMAIAAGAALAFTPVTAQDGSAELEAFAKKEAASAVESRVASGLQSLSENLEVSIAGLENGKPVFSILKVAPLMDNRQDGQVLFAQASVSRNEGRNTGNIGLAYRQLLANDTIILGINGFYDSEWTYEHERTSLGLEALTSVGDLRVNQYWAQSDAEIGKNGASERALDGFDVELAIPLPYLPRTKLTAKAFEYDGNGSNTEIEGEQYSLRTDLPFGMVFEGGTTSYDKDLQDQDFVSLSFNMTLGKSGNVSQAPFVSSRAYQLDAVTDRRFEKVRRANTITKTTGGTFRVTVSGV